MSSYKNRNALLHDVIVTANGRIYKNNKKIGQIMGCESDEIKDNRVLDPTKYDYVISFRCGLMGFGIPNRSSSY